MGLSRLIDALLGRFCDGVSETAISPTWGSLGAIDESSALRSRDQNTQPEDFAPSPCNVGGADGSFGRIWESDTEERVALDSNTADVLSIF